MWLAPCGGQGVEQQPGEGGGGGGLDGAAGSGEMQEDGDGRGIRGRQGNPDGSDGFPQGAAARAGDASDGQRVIGPEGLQRPARHGQGHGTGNCAITPEKIARNIQEAALGFVGIGNDAPEEPAGSPGQGGAAVGKQAAGARFRASQGELSGGQPPRHPAD